jgi:hypothetical protein
VVNCVFGQLGLTTTRLRPRPGDRDDHAAAGMRSITPCILQMSLGEKGSRKKERQVVISLDDLEYSYPEDGDHCYLCGRKWDSHSPWEFFYLDSNLLCEECAPQYRRARSRRETKQE